jgi:hypothetical protein
MAITYKKAFQPTVLTTSLATLFTVDTAPTNVLLRGGRVRFTNTSGVAVPVTACAVPAGGSGGTGNTIVNARSIGPGDYLDIDLPTMAAGDFLQALAGSATSITAHYISGAFYS